MIPRNLFTRKVNDHNSDMYNKGIDSRHHQINRLFSRLGFT
ncbi:MAG: hypothetical protein KA053_09375 [Lentimicrobiaceae bacterium]|nr:hypothetical protein [Lentimicrobiaceae bacterium]